MRRLQLYLKVFYLFITRQLVSTADIAKSYDLVSETYEAHFYNEMKRYNEENIDYILTLNKNNQLNVLDLACGCGNNSKYFSEFIDAKYTLVDLSIGMLNKAKHLKLEAAYINEGMLDFLKHEKENKYDVIVCHWALKYENPKVLIKECYKKLKHGGYLSVIVNAKATLPEVRKTYPILLENNIRKIDKLMLELPNPSTLSKFDQLFIKSNFKVVVSKSNQHAFTFQTSKEAVDFVVKTGALAGFDQMIDLNDNDIKNDLTNLFERRGYLQITHCFYQGIFQKEQCNKNE